MNKKKWIVIAFAVILLVAASLSNSFRQEGSSEDKTDWFNQQMTSLLSDKNYVEKIREEGDPSQRILVIPIEGVIGGNNSAYNQELILDTIEQIRNDESIAAVVLEIDTPGGSVYETREAYDLFKEIQKERHIPVYASMKSVAASAGYYYAMLADKVYATPETLTGSIGVIISGQNVSKLLNKIGIESYVFKSADLKDMGSSTREMTQEEKDIFQNMIDESFDTFVKVVMEGRHMKEDKVRKLATGQVYTAQQAVDNDLIDGIKYYRQVIDQVRTDNDLQDAQIFEKVSDNETFSGIFSSFMKGQKSYLDQFNEIIDRSERLDLPKVEYRWEGGY